MYISAAAAAAEQGMPKNPTAQNPGTRSTLEENGSDFWRIKRPKLKVFAKSPGISIKTCTHWNLRKEKGGRNFARPKKFELLSRHKETPDRDWMQREGSKAADLHCLTTPAWKINKRKLSYWTVGSKTPHQSCQNFVWWKYWRFWRNDAAGCWLILHCCVCSCSNAVAIGCRNSNEFQFLMTFWLVWNQLIRLGAIKCRLQFSNSSIVNFLPPTPLKIWQLIFMNYWGVPKSWASLENDGSADSSCFGGRNPKRLKTHAIGWTPKWF